MRAAMNTWQYYLLELERQEDVLRKSGMCWFRIGALRALNQWHWQVEQAQIRQELTFKSMVRWISNKMTQSFMTWRHNAGGAEEEEEAVMIASQHFKFTSLAAYLSFWRVITDISLQNDTLASDNQEKADDHLNYGYLRKAFSNW